MSEAEFEPGDSAEPVRTGVAAIDEVLASIEGLEDAPLEEHAAAFGSAHDALRRALDADAEA